MARDFTHLKDPNPLSNQEWAKLVKDHVQDINILLAEANERDVMVQILQQKGYAHEEPVLTLLLSERLA